MTNNSVTPWLGGDPEKFDAELERARMVGDVPHDGFDVDDLMGQLLRADLKAREEGKENYSGKRGYNRLLDMADVLMADPELMLVEGSKLYQFLKYDDSIPDAAKAYYSPIEAPDWIDEDQIALAQKIWENNVVIMLAVLYSSSLPTTYLMKKGIAVLYSTGKLAKPKYAGQRLFETALMLDRAMSPGGIRVVKDAKVDSEELLREALDEVAHGAWDIHHKRVYLNQEDELLKTLDRDSFLEKISETYETLDAKHELQRNRYLWGPGFFSARKVRALHASMRYMLTHPEEFVPKNQEQRLSAETNSTHFAHELKRRAHHDIQWDVNVYGHPVNQEDQAFTLLTFGYLLPRGMEEWGCRLSHEEKNAVLHLWKVIGYVMGIRTDFTTDQLDEAEELYRRLLNRQISPERQEASEQLTTTTTGFLSQYLPTRFGVAKWLPSSMVLDQVSIDENLVDPKIKGSSSLSERLLTPAMLKGLRAPHRRFFHWGTVTVLRTYYFVRRHCFVHLPMVGGVIDNLFHAPAREFYETFKDDYQRRPFYVPQNATDWILEQGIPPGYENKIILWRRRLFGRLTLGVACMMASAVLALAFLTLLVSKAMIYILDPSVRELYQLALKSLINWMTALGCLSALFMILSWWICNFWVHRLFTKKPAFTPKDEDPGATQ